MPKKERVTISVDSVDDLFKTDEQREDDLRERVIEIPLDALHPFKDHPFHVSNDEELKGLAESIAENGMVTPAIARPRKDGGYELIAGHRRKAACRMAGIETMPVLVRDMDDDTATIIMVDSNKQRENLLASEKAFAYKMRLEAVKHQGKSTSCQVGTKLRSDEEIAATIDESARNKSSVSLISFPARKKVSATNRLLRKSDCR